MSKFRFVLLSAVAALVVSLAATAAASAHEYKVEGKTIAKETGVTGSGSGEYVLKGTPLGIKTEIKCAKVKVEKGAIDVGGVDKGTSELGFTECKVEKPAGCSVAEPIKANDRTVLAETPVQELFEPPTGSTTFAEITLTGCVVAGTFKVEGSQLCELPNAGTESTSHEVVCKTTGSKLKFGGKAAEFSGSPVTIELSTKQKFSAV